MADKNSLRTKVPIVSLPLVDGAGLGVSRPAAGASAPALFGTVRRMAHAEADGAALLAMLGLDSLSG